MSEIDTILNYLNKKEIELCIAMEDYSKNNISIARHKSYLLNAEKCKIFILQISEQNQQKTIKYIEETVTFALQSVFGEDYIFYMKPDYSKRDQMEISFFVEHLGIELEPREDTIGGGVVDVCSFALQIICLTLEYPNVASILILDEPFKNINGEQYRKAVAKMVKDISRLLKIQVIMASQIENFLEIADNIIYV